ncbi:MAG: DNA alkylation repair protein [Nitrospira sp.]|nr:DNA alkylation repair protein [Nitrospira sp.]
METANRVLVELKKLARPDKAEFLPKFFQAYEGGYGEGDQFLGVVVPPQRRLAKQFRDLSAEHVEQLLHSPWHEARLTGLFILVSQYERSCDKLKRSELVSFYLTQLDWVNNWDLVDSSAHKILGAHLVDNPTQRSLLTKLAKAKSLWHQRVAVIATLALIKNREFTEILVLSEKLLNHRHDLMHKAIGWMLREVGKQDIVVLRHFLEQHSTRMPRTMLRYAIEKMSQEERQEWLTRK